MGLDNVFKVGMELVCWQPVFSLKGHQDESLVIANDRERKWRWPCREEGEGWYGRVGKKARREKTVCKLFLLFLNPPSAQQRSTWLVNMCPMIFPRKTSWFQLVYWLIWLVFWQVWMSSKTWEETAVCFSSRACRPHVSSHSPFAKTSRLITPTNYERKTDCQQSIKSLTAIWQFTSVRIL